VARGGYIVAETLSVSPECKRVAILLSKRGFVRTHPNIFGSHHKALPVLATQNRGSNARQRRTPTAAQATAIVSRPTPAIPCTTSAVPTWTSPARVVLIVRRRTLLEALNTWR